MFLYSYQIVINGGVSFFGTIHAPNIEEANAKANNIAIGIVEKFNNGSIAQFLRTSIRPKGENIHTMHVTEYTTDVKLSQIVDDWGDSHNPKLREVINKIFANVECHPMLDNIMRAYYERDKEEIANYYSDECIWQRADKLSYEEMLDNMDIDTLWGEMLNHIFDDEDYKAIINFIRPRWITNEWWTLMEV